MIDRALTDSRFRHITVSTHGRIVARPTSLHAAAIAVLRHGWEDTEVRIRGQLLTEAQKALVPTDLRPFLG